MNEYSNLLAALSDGDRKIIEPYLKEFEFDAGTTLVESGEPVQYCYFPIGATLASFFVSLEGGQIVEATLVGREGAIGGIVSQGYNPAFARAVVVSAGKMKRIAISDLDRSKARSETIADLFSRYADCVMAQVFQSIACNATHSIERRAAKWIGTALELTGEANIDMTQEQLASMMGVGRSYASRVVQRFKQDDLIRTRRGGIVVLDRERLARRACECHEKVRDHFDTVLAGVYPNAENGTRSAPESTMRSDRAPSAPA